MVAGLGLMVGLAASRFLKASSERRYDSAQSNGNRQRTHGYGAGGRPSSSARAGELGGERRCAQQRASELRERPIGEVAKDLTSDLSLLVRQEIELAKAEMAEKGRTAAPGLGMFGGAGVVGLWRPAR